MRQSKTRTKSQKTNLDSLLDELRGRAWEPNLTQRSYERILQAGFRNKNLLLASVATQIAWVEQPLTLRGLMYRVVSAGWLPSTDREHYSRLGRIMTTLRETGIVPFAGIVDNVRSTIKPSSWSGLNDYVETVRDCYRKDFWASLPEYCHVIVEKDAIAGTLIAGLARGRLVAAKVVSNAAREAYADLAPAMKQWRTKGMTLEAIADRLNSEGHTTRRGRPWNATQVFRVLERTSVTA